MAETSNVRIMANYAGSGALDFFSDHCPEHKLPKTFGGPGPL